MGLAAGLVSGCLGGNAGPSDDPAFETGAAAYSFVTVGATNEVTITYTFRNTTTTLGAIQGCFGMVPFWTLEKLVNGSWQVAYPAPCTADPSSGVAVAPGGQYQGTILLLDAVDANGTPRITLRPVAGTYRLKFGLFEGVSLVTGEGTRVTDGRTYSNTFTLE